MQREIETLRRTNRKKKQMKENNELYNVTVFMKKKLYENINRRLTKILEIFEIN